ncbi:MAG: ATP-binding protein [Deltaproteobacteria bacterium]|nr:ATP-binding protein [Deltaproteobacteria bacterium]
MKRLVENQILAWKNSHRRKPLIIRGARQVGKTWLVENVLAKEFDETATIDLEVRRDLHAYFDGNLEPQAVLKGLEFAVGRIIPGKTLLFIDEIQACPRAIMALRYFYEIMPELHVVAAGSLLEFAFGEISIPVGRIQYLHLYPMTFYEYLLATDKHSMAEQVLSYQGDLDNNLQKAILDELKNYFFVGGMPEAVDTYRDTGSLLETLAVQSDIIDSYRDDFSKYTPRVDVTCLDEVFLNVSKSVGEQLKYTRLSGSHSYQTNHKAFDLLAKARVIHKIPSCDPSGLPLAASANSRKFKACMLDIGLLQRLCRVPVDIEIATDNLLAIYRGKLAEQFVAQELIAWHSPEIFYWARNAKSSNAEVDYLSVKKGEIYPVEVKSGPSGKLRSLHLMLQNYPNCPGGLVLYSGVHKELPEQKITFMPLYATAAIGDKHQLKR